MGSVTLPLSELYSPIRDELAFVERIFDEELVSALACVEQFHSRLRGYRGKMLRPALLLLSGKAAGKLTSEHNTLAAVVEMVHMATLVHDDVLDEAVERRRQATVNAVSGNVAAVLLGDYLISHAFHLCSELDSQSASRLVGATTNAVCEGELLQNHHRGNVSLSEEEYYQIVSRKTGALTATCCELGARHAGADDDVAYSMRAYGMSAGIAFQIVDDVLDIMGKASQVGKTLGRDIDLGKSTLPTIHSLMQATPETARRLAALLNDEDGADHQELRHLLDKTGSIEYAIASAREHVVDALGRLECLPPSEAKTSLTAMAEFIVERRY